MYRPIFTVDSPNHLQRLQPLLAAQPELDYGLLMTVQTATPNLWHQARCLGVPLYLDSGVFEKSARLPWYLQEQRIWTGSI
jgi:hypothetical protein